MRNQAYINDKDIYSNWKAQLVKGAYEALLTPSPMKDYISNKSRVENGCRYVATPATSKTDEREVQISFFIEGETETEYLQNYEGFMNEVASGMFTFRVPKLGKTYKMIYLSCARYGDFGIKKGKVTLKLKEPNTKDRG